MRNPMLQNLVYSILSSLDGIVPRLAIDEYIQLRDFRDPAPIHFTVELKRELHDPSVTPPESTRSARIDSVEALQQDVGRWEPQ